MENELPAQPTTEPTTVANPWDMDLLEKLYLACHPAPGVTTTDGGAFDHAIGEAFPAILAERLSLLEENAKLNEYYGNVCSEVAKLKIELKATREQNARLLEKMDRLKTEFEWRKEPDFPDWGDVRIKNYSVATPEELLAAAKRLVEQGETLGGCGSPYGKHTGFAAQFDEIAVGEAYQVLREENARLHNVLLERHNEIAALRKELGL